MSADNLNRLFVVLAVVCVMAVIVNMKPKPKSIAAPSDTWFQESVVNQKKPTLVKFGAEWCGPCKALDAELDKLESRLGSKINIVRVNVDEKPELAQHYGVSGIPHIFLMDKGQILADQVGADDSQSLARWVEGNLPKK